MKCNSNQDLRTGRKKCSLNAKRYGVFAPGSSAKVFLQYCPKHLPALITFLNSFKVVLPERNCKDHKNGLVHKNKYWKVADSILRIAKEDYARWKREQRKKPENRVMIV